MEKVTSVMNRLIITNVMDIGGQLGSTMSIVERSLTTLEYLEKELLANEELLANVLQEKLKASH